ncbi:MAG TPA: antibiotic biosynthesis monooxygenase [Sphingomonas sp.]|uniref:antibiotic biosynthesis monooxygenase family protein n=1 Tax=Sphingomonas sp. TaxID=28214 RepID=UPI002C162A76|nr:antibiotic biosynthesis monooxygenase [Sphingomonas sp.]HMI19929.1 antibiotic biosynthesis monooxygenase [Sphingomonas sp.]
MIVQHAMLRIREGASDGFEAALRDAIPLIALSPGYRGIEVRPAAETVGFYLLRIFWDDIASHRDGFRKSDRYDQVRDLLLPFYEPWPEVSYFGAPIIDSGVIAE